MASTYSILHNLAYEDTSIVTTGFLISLRYILSVSISIDYLLNLLKLDLLDIFSTEI